AGARSHRRRRRGRSRPGRGTVPGGSPHRGAGRRVPWGRLRLLSGPTGDQGGGRVLPMRLARVLGAVGRTFITAGVLILLFVAYQLWGTGIREAQAQGRLEDAF